MCKIIGVCLDSAKIYLQSLSANVSVSLCPYLCMNVLLLSGNQAFVWGSRVGRWEVHTHVPVYSGPAYC